MRNNRAATTARTAPATKEKVLSTNRYEQLGIHSSKQGLEAILSRREAAIPTNSRVDEAASKARARQQTRAGKKLLSDADVIAVDLCLGSGLTRKRQEAGAFSRQRTILGFLFRPRGRSEFSRDFRQKERNI